MIFPAFGEQIKFLVMIDEVMAAARKNEY